MITALEEISLNALPALQNVFYQGWVLRHSRGYSRRANYVQPLRNAKLPLAERIAFCETIYREHQLPVIFKMTPASQPANLDAELEARGYTCEAETSVQTCALDTAPPLSERVRIAETWSDEWYAVYCRSVGLSEANRDTLAQMLHLLVPQPAFALSSDADGPIACGLGVLQGEYLGLYDIVVDAAKRRRGYGNELVNALLAWGHAHGARTAYLQVMRNNAPAQQLYARLGFLEQYRYWYRVRA